MDGDTHFLFNAYVVNHLFLLFLLTELNNKCFLLFSIHPIKNNKDNRFCCMTSLY